MRRPTHARLFIVLSWSCLLALICSSVPRIASAQHAADGERELAAKLLSAKGDEERKAILAAEKELVTVELVRAVVSEGDHLETQGAYSAALDSYGLALSMAEQLHDLAGAAHSLRGIGLVLISQGDCARALERFRESLKITEETGDKNGISATLNNIGYAYYRQGDYAQALEHLHRSLRISEESGDKKEFAGALNNIGLVRIWQGDYTQALEHLRKSLEISQEIGAKKEIANALNGIGLIHYAQGSYAQALEHLRKSLEISQEIGHKNGIAKTLNNIGIAHYAQGNYTEALEHLQKSLKIGEEIADKGVIEGCLNNIGNVHYSQGNYSQALEHYQKSLRMSEEIGNKNGIVTSLNNIGNIQRSQGNYSQALECLHKSLGISEEMGDKKEFANALNAIGLIHYAQCDYAQALEYLHKSLKIKEGIGDRLGISTTLNNIGLVHYAQGDHTRAIEHLRKSLSIKEEIGDKEGIPDAVGTIGLFHYMQGDYSQAREEFARAIAAVEELRGRVAGDEQQQQQFFQTRLSPYHLMIRLLVDEKNQAEAFAYAERVKGRALLDTLEIGHVNVTKAMTDGERAEEQRLNAEVVALNTQIYNENLRDQPDKTVLADLQARRDKARAGYEAFQVNLYAAHPELKAQRGQMKPITVEEAGKLIPNAGTAVAQYVVTADKTFLFVLTKAQQARLDSQPSSNVPALKVYTINIRQKELADRVSRFHGRLSQKDIDFTKSARDLYDLLIGPARADLKDKTALMIVPDGVLWQVPFQALKPSANRYLVEDYAISYAPSLTVLREMMNLKQKRRPASGKTSTLVAFGNPDVDPTTAANLRAVYPEVLADEKLLPLPQTEALVKALSHIYGPDRSKIYVREEAREDRAKKEASTCRILQFATHGILDNINPMYSRLVMSQSGVSDQEDGMLEAWEIMNLDLNAEMVILSACDTARGRVAGGEGMIGLAWAFFVAGCPTTVVSQWPVEVNSASELTVELHKRLKPSFEARNSDVSKAEALRSAMLKMMRNPRYRHPFYWAPFVVIGDAH
jgi:tetratricopeptide (TPR) repeat protein